MAEDILIVEERGGIATVTLNRPESMNALSQALRHRIAETFAQLAQIVRLHFRNSHSLKIHPLQRELAFSFCLQGGKSFLQFAEQISPLLHVVLSQFIESFVWHAALFREDFSGRLFLLRSGL